MVGQERAPLGVWVYVAALVAVLLHGLSLTVASVIIYARPGLVGTNAFVPLPSLLIYVATNMVEFVYIVVLFVWIVQRRRAVTAASIAFAVVATGFLVVWHALGEKSTVGTFVDDIPPVVGAFYFGLSPSVRRTFGRSGRPSRGGGRERSGPGGVQDREGTPAKAPSGGGVEF